jgi:hypothetical protein
MRIHALLQLSLAAALACASADAVAAQVNQVGTLATQPTSYALVCRGGPAVTMTTHAVLTGTPSTRLHVRFAAGRRPAVEGVDPGTCAWQDRAMLSTESSTLCFSRVETVMFEMAGNREVRWTRVQANVNLRPVIFWEGGERPDGAAIRISSTEAQYYRAYSTSHSGVRCLMVTHVGP